MEQNYFNGKSVIKRNVYPFGDSKIEGTDGFSFAPINTFEKANTKFFFENLMRSGEIKYYSSKKYLYLNLMRYVISEKELQKTPDKANFNQLKYNGLANLTSVYSSSLFASKPYYFQCDLNKAYLPVINIIQQNKTKPIDYEEIDLYRESFFDIEPYSGIVLRSGNKWMYSYQLENDALFDFSHDLFLPLYFSFNSYNYTDIGVL